MSLTWRCSGTSTGSPTCCSSQPGGRSQVERADGQPRHMSGRTPVTVMMCDDCRERYGHDLMPAAGAPSFCYRCGTRDEVFISEGQSPITYHVCPRCVPDRAARYRAGQFEDV